MPQERQRLVIDPRNERRLRAGHLWVFSNEIKDAKAALATVTAGDEVLVEDAKGKPFGVGYVNPNSLIAVRLVSRNPKQSISRGLIERRLAAALELRGSLGKEHYGRMVFGESDGLPGLVLDRYGDHMVGQITTLGMDIRREIIESAIKRVYSPQSLRWHNDSPMRGLEGLERARTIAFGQAPENLHVREREMEFVIGADGSQKTGWFYDQTDNRERAFQVMGGARVLDLFAYAGGWGLGALKAGAQSATLVDSSAGACASTAQSASHNGLSAHIEQSDVGAYLDKALAAQERFDVVVVDPPAFAKRKKDVASAKKGYRQINEKAIRLVRPGGFLVSCSCSYHMFEDAFFDTLAAAARHVDRHLTVVQRLEQSSDHPVHPAIVETRYLKGLVARVDHRDY